MDHGCSLGMIALAMGASVGAWLQGRRGPHPGWPGKCPTGVRSSAGGSLNCPGFAEPLTFLGWCHSPGSPSPRAPGVWAWVPARCGHRAASSACREPVWRPVCPATSPGLQGWTCCCRPPAVCSHLTHLVHSEEASGAWKCEGLGLSCLLDCRQELGRF